LNKLALVFLLALLLILLEADLSHAEVTSPVGSVPTTLVEALDLALRSSTELKIEDEKITASRFRVLKAKGNFSPTLDIWGISSFTRNFDIFTGYNVSGIMSGAPIQVAVTKSVPEYQMVGGLEVNYNLYAGGKDRAAVFEENSKLSAAGFQKKTVKNRLILSVSRAYWYLTRSEVLLTAAQRNADYSRSSYQVARQREQSGLISRRDLETEQLNMEEKKLAVAQARRDLEQRLVSNRAALGLPALTTPGSPLQGFSYDPEQYRVVEELLATDHPQMNQQLKEIEAAEAEIDVVRAPYYPKLDLYLDYSVVGRSDSSYFKSLTSVNNDNFAIGLKVTYNLFGGFKTSRAVEESRAGAGRAACSRTERKNASRGTDRKVCPHKSP